MEQLIAHLAGDYLLQSQWMATEKTKQSLAAGVHAFTYTLPFLLLTHSLIALFVICSTHFLIDRYRLARYVIYAKNFIAPEREIFMRPEHELLPFEKDEFKDQYKWENCKATGYPSEVPAWLATALMIVADNTLHLFINYCSVRYL